MYIKKTLNADCPPSFDPRRRVSPRLRLCIVFQGVDPEKTHRCRQAKVLRGMSTYQFSPSEVQFAGETRGGGRQRAYPFARPGNSEKALCASSGLPPLTDPA